MDNPIHPAILGGMNYDCDISIVGGGLNGCALAIALASGGLSVTLIDSLAVDAVQEDSFDGRSYALALASKRLLSAVGLWDDVAKDAQPMLEIKVTDGRAGEGPSPFWMHFDHTEIEEGPMGFMVEDRHLRRAFLSKISKTDSITHLTPETVVAQSVDQTSAAVVLASGKTVRSRLLAGCDGRRSGVAERAGIGRSFKDYGQTALVAAIGHELPHNGIAHQFFMPAGPLAILPLSGNRSSIVWAETHDRAAELSELSDEAFIEALRPAFGDFLGDIHVAGARFSYPLNLTLADRLVDERMVLVGDAAHGVHPIAGQGLNLGLRDVGALAQVLVDARRRGEDIGSEAVLVRYEEWRRFDTTTLALATNSFNGLFSNDNPILRAGRDIGMGLVNAFPALRRNFIREAAGLTGDLPRLLQGRSL
ncbi:2-octaprenyl-6-methoxyphenol hydroxylase [Litoreibacter ascidiaceicola]|uniref:2-octaprenyl-6-methoxyphenol hydroxylase n=1 Tax=Litoreibacter ascidiaceicola TaxID=1486859 RepID=A0A1M5D1I7_9RHOB|nr:UbiH/UbiF/VisC/COQ6 family ubiquinone biosynthesis hydroxylase [Litoreibacter ascidiaceicola]SHF60677.1 2-octaprenyl-6-methoxyphenol hydroxylase [Litoreibacter ascidiaceicola]